MVAGVARIVRLTETVGVAQPLNPMLSEASLFESARPASAGGLSALESRP